MESALRVGSAWRELRRGAAMGAVRSRTLIIDGVQLELGQADAMEILSAHDTPITMTEFAEAMRIDRSTATRAVDRLESLGFATRTADQPDSRVKRVAITSSGMAALEQVRHKRFSYLISTFEDFDDAELEQLANLLDRLVKGVDRVVATM